MFTKESIASRITADTTRIALLLLRHLAYLETFASTESPHFSFFFSSRRRHTSFKCDWSSDVCSSDLKPNTPPGPAHPTVTPSRICGGCSATAASRASSCAPTRHLCPKERKPPLTPK